MGINGKYYKYRIKNFQKVILKKIKKYNITNLNTYAGKRNLSAEEGNELIKNAILLGDAFCAVRYGSSELATSVDTIEIDNGRLKEVRDKCILSLCRNAGFFPNNKQLAYKYGKMQLELTRHADLFAIWGMNMEDYVLDVYGNPCSNICLPRAFEPYYFERPWSAELRGKKVLIIHPFEETIKRQYEKRDKLFKNPNILPEFTLHTLKAVQSAAYSKTEFKTWFDALEYMFSESMKIDFDIAIIGCGAYGLSLACMLKAAGKIAIHMGGATQILFGIKGNRWDNHPFISKLYNEYWVRPNSAETPLKANEVENACYW